MGLIPGSGKSPGEGNDNPLQYSCLENAMDRGVWWATFHGVAELDTAEHTGTHAYTCFKDLSFFLYSVPTAPQAASCCGPKAWDQMLKV